MFFLSFLIFLIAIFWGARLGGMGIAYASGLGLFIFTMVFGMAPGNLPISVIIIILSVISAVAVLQATGGLDYMVKIAERILRSNPKYINILAPVVTYVMTVLVGTSHSVYSVIPVIVQVSKEQNIKPVRPLAASEFASHLGITSSPIAAAVVALLGISANFDLGFTLGKMLMVLFPAGLITAIVIGIFQSLRSQSLADDENYKALLAKKGFEEKEGEIIKKVDNKEKNENMGAKTLAVFLGAVAVIVIFSMFPSLKPIYETTGKGIATAHLIVIIMLTAGLFIVLISKVDIGVLPSQSTFKAGMAAVVCVVGVAWLGDTYIANYKEEIKLLAGDFVKTNPWAFPLALAFVTTLLYSQTATTLAIIPIGAALGLSPVVILASFPAVNALCFLPTYPTLIATVQMDTTGTTKLGKYVFDHPFLLPGVVGLVISVVLSFIFASMIL